MKHIKIFENFNDNKIHDIDTIVDSYLETLLWAEKGTMIDDEDEDDIDPLDDKTIYDFDIKSKSEIEDQILWFVEVADEYLEDLTDEQIGHNLWLTRNHHGYGFQDEIEDEENYNMIKKLCDILDGVELYVDNDKVYHNSSTKYKHFNIEEYKKKNEFDKTVKKYNI